VSVEWSACLPAATKQLPLDRPHGGIGGSVSLPRRHCRSLIEADQWHHDVKSLNDGLAHHNREIIAKWTP
jgi:hypothetical protein